MSHPSSQLVLHPTSTDEQQMLVNIFTRYMEAGTFCIDAIETRQVSRMHSPTEMEDTLYVILHTSNMNRMLMHFIALGLMSTVNDFGG